MKDFGVFPYRVKWVSSDNTYRYKDLKFLISHKIIPIKREDIDPYNEEDWGYDIKENFIKDFSVFNEVFDYDFESPKTSFPNITIVNANETFCSAFYLNDELKTDCCDGEGYAYGEVLRIMGIYYKTLDITKEDFENRLNCIFPEDLKELKRKIKKPKLKSKSPDRSDIDPYGEEDWDEDNLGKKKKGPPPKLFIKHF
jgi:hypothetical protein